VDTGFVGRSRRGTDIVDRTSDNMIGRRRALPPTEACRLVERFEWHYTPKHGSWLDMAEAELSLLSTLRLDRRLPNKLTLTEQVPEWQALRSKNNTKADRHFTTEAAAT